MDTKKTIKEELSGEKSGTDDVENKLGEAYNTDNWSENDMLRDKCQHETLRMYKKEPAKPEEIVKELRG